MPFSALSTKNKMNFVLVPCTRSSLFLSFLHSIFSVHCLSFRVHLCTSHHPICSIWLVSRIVSMFHYYSIICYILVPHSPFFLSIRLDSINRYIYFSLKKFTRSRNEMHVLHLVCIVVTRQCTCQRNIIISFQSTDIMH